MEKNESVRNKIIILYILSRIPGISVGELTSMAMDTCYMNYFEFAQALDDLTISSYITKSVRKGETAKDSEGKPVHRCDMTPIGMETLNRLSHLIPEQIYTFLNKAFIDWEKNIRRNTEVKAYYDPDLYGGYNVTLTLSDGNRDMIRLMLSVPSKEMAIATCNNWKNNTQAQYLRILSGLSVN